MTVEELIEQLSDMNPSAEIRLAIQPNYPFEFDVQDEIVQTEDESKVFIGEGRQIGYLEEEPRELLNW